MKDYGRKSVFSGFLPGIAGKCGIPMWCFYVNRGQGVVSFGIEDKEHAIMEFYPAHVAYQNVKRTGFRTFIKKDGQFYELFSGEELAQEMEIGRNHMQILEENQESGLQTKVIYYVLPEEPVAALAIDLAGICSKVTVLEFMDELKADQVLQEKAKSLPNVEIFVSSQTTEVVGNGDKVTGIRTKDRKTGEERVIHLDGIFVQIGLAANSGVFKEIVETNRPGEIVIDAHCRTNVPGIYAAGDVSTVPFKQIIISMGEGAKAALSAFEDRVRGVLD